MRRFLLILLPALALATAAHAGELNDTGITDCSNDTAVVTTGVEADSGTHPRQDCRYGRDAAAAAGALTKIGGGGKGFDFSKIANDGTVLDATAALGTGANQWACTRDNVTGLMWEVKTADGGLRDQSNTYFWYNTDSSSNGGYAGTAGSGSVICTGGIDCNTQSYVAAVNAAGLCGYADWRMPTRNELVSIVDYGRIGSNTNPAMDPTYFPNTPVSIFMSASATSYDSNYVWVVIFSAGHVNMGQKDSSSMVRLVRAGQ